MYLTGYMEGDGCIEKSKNINTTKDEILYVEGDFDVITVSEVLEDIENYRNAKLYTTIPHPAIFSAEEILNDAIDQEQENGMYEDWDDKIRADITKQDIADLQAIFDRILARNPSQNISYEQDKLIEIDI